MPFCRDSLELLSSYLGRSEGGRHLQLYVEIVVRTICEAGKAVHTEVRSGLALRLGHRLVRSSEGLQASAIREVLGAKAPTKPLLNKTLAELAKDQLRWASPIASLAPTYRLVFRRRYACLVTREGTSVIESPPWASARSQGAAPVHWVPNETQPDPPPVLPLIRPGNYVPTAHSKLSVLLSSEAAAVFFHEALGHLLELDPSLEPELAKRMGKVISSRSLSVVDDPSIKCLVGSFSHDDTGKPARKITLLDEGCLISTIAAASFGRKRTSAFDREPMPRMSNIVVAGGGSSEDSLMAACGDGLLIDLALPAQLDISSMTLAMKVRAGWKLQDGKRARRLAEFWIGGDVWELLSSVEAVGSKAEAAKAVGGCLKNGDWVPVGCISPPVLVGAFQILGA